MIQDDTVQCTLREGLPYLRDKLSRKEAMTIAFIGGSITEGAYATHPDTGSWRALVSSRLAGAYPESAIEFINAGVGGTDSTFGAFRFDEHVLKYGPPDLLFVEFAVNDDKDRLKAVQGMEAILRKCRLSNPQSDVCFLYSADRRCLKSPEVIAWHEEVAEFYHIPSANIAHGIARRVEEGAFKWEHYASDDVHPTDEGHALYADLLWGFIEYALEEAVSCGETLRMLPAKSLEALPYTKARLEQPTAAGQHSEGFTWVDNYSPQPLWNWRYERSVLQSTSPGDELRLEFTGTAIGCVLIAGQDTGQLEYALEDGIWHAANLYDSWCEQCWRPKPLLFFTDLAPSGHTLHLRHDQPVGKRQDGNTLVSIVKFLIG